MYKMRTEVPLFKRCCFCLPVRPGILVWSYIKLIITLLLTVSAIFEVIFFISRSYFHFFGIDDIIRYCADFLLRIFCFCCTILLIIACHKKSTKLLRVSYKCELVAVIGCFMLVLFCIINDLISVFTRTHASERFFRYYIRYLTVTGLVTLIYIGLQFYIIAVIRSEIIKLESTHNFRFVNNAAEAECKYYSAPDNNIKHNGETEEKTIAK